MCACVRVYACACAKFGREAPAAEFEGIEVGKEGRGGEKGKG